MVGRRPWVFAALVLVASGATLLYSARGGFFSGDDLSYYGREVLVSPFETRHFDSASLEYLLIPHNGPIGGHLQLGGKLVYEGLFGLFGTDYDGFRVVAVLAVLACVALLFVLVRRRLGTGAAVLAAIWLGFLGAAWEVLLWPFDLHTSVACACGLGALLALERGGRRSDLAACVLLVVGIAFIEAALVFLVAVAVSVLMRPDRWRRAWVFAVPLALFGAWWLWSLHYDFPTTTGGIGDIPQALFDSLRIVLTALVGVMPTGVGHFPPQIDPGPLGTVLAIAAIAALIALAVTRRIPATTWPLIAAGLVYWALLGLGDRDPDSSRYVFLGAILVILVTADLLREHRPGPVALGAVAALIAFSMVVGNLAKLGDGGGYLRNDAELVRNEFAMLGLAGDHGDPNYEPWLDPEARAAGSQSALVMSTGDYLAAARSRGSLAGSLDEVRASSPFVRRADDVLLADALGIALEPAAAPADDAGCRSTQDSAAVALRPGGALIEAGQTPVNLGLGRFLADQPSKSLGELAAGTWGRIAPPPDDAPEPWRLFADGRISVCPLG